MDHIHSYGYSDEGACACGAYPCEVAGCPNVGTERDYGSPCIDYYCTEHAVFANRHAWV